VRKLENAEVDRLRKEIKDADSAISKTIDLDKLGKKDLQLVKKVLKAKQKHEASESGSEGSQKPDTDTELTVFGGD